MFIENILKCFSPLFYGLSKNVLSYIMVFCFIYVVYTINYVLVSIVCVYFIKRNDETVF